MHTWEVARSKSLRARLPVLREARPGPEMLEAVRAVLAAGSAVLVTRSDQTAEALREKWESEFYDEYEIRSGPNAGAIRRRRRYRKTDVERAWEQHFADLRRTARSNRSLGKQGHLACDRCSRTWSRHAPADYQHECDNPERDEVEE